MSKRSHDMVRFTVPYHRIDQKYADLLCTVFNLKREEICGPTARHDSALRYEAMTIECRPSQFGRFLILRHAIGIANSFVELDAVLVQERPSKKLVFNVENRPGYVHVEGFLKGQGVKPVGSPDRRGM